MPTDIERRFIEQRDEGTMSSSQDISLVDRFNAAPDWLESMSRSNATSQEENRMRIEVNPLVMLGKPVIRNTRVPVETILGKLQRGIRISQILASFPRLTFDDVLAAIEYSRQSRS